MATKAFPSTGFPFGSPTSARIDCPSCRGKKTTSWRSPKAANKTLLQVRSKRQTRKMRLSRPAKCGTIGDLLIGIYGYLHPPSILGTRVAKRRAEGRRFCERGVSKIHLASEAASRFFRGRPCVRSIVSLHLPRGDSPRPSHRSSTTAQRTENWFGLRWKEVSPLIGWN